ncbi:MAG: hypothetical protein MHM6MM_004150 [Cercozoa sp. M6MM]
MDSPHSARPRLKLSNNSLNVSTIAKMRHRFGKRAKAARQHAQQRRRRRLAPTYNSVYSNSANAETDTGDGRVTHEFGRLLPLKLRFVPLDAVVVDESGDSTVQHHDPDTQVREAQERAVAEKVLLRKKLATLHKLHDARLVKLRKRQSDERKLVLQNISKRAREQVLVGTFDEPFKFASESLDTSDISQITGLTSGPLDRTSPSGLSLISRPVRGNKVFTFNTSTLVKGSMDTATVDTEMNTMLDGDQENTDDTWKYDLDVLALRHKAQLTQLETQLQQHVAALHDSVWPRYTRIVSSMREGKSASVRRAAAAMRVAPIRWHLLQKQGNKRESKTEGAADTTLLEGQLPQEAAIAILMYNEPWEQLALTLASIAQNISVLCTLRGSQEAWKGISVWLLADGIDKMDQSTVDSLNRLGLFDFKAARKRTDCADGRPDQQQIHIFESRVRFQREVEGGVGVHTKQVTYAPINLFIAAKQRNGGKLDSHIWFYDVLASSVRPGVVVNFDVGTFAAPTALVNVLESFQSTDCDGGQVSVASSLIMPDGAARDNFLGRFQIWEYATGFFMKGVEHMCGLTLVCPGAFSAFRWDSICRKQGQQTAQVPTSFVEDTMEEAPVEQEEHHAKDSAKQPKVASLSLHRLDESENESTEETDGYEEETGSTKPSEEGVDATSVPLIVEREPTSPAVEKNSVDPKQKLESVHELQGVAESESSKEQEKDSSEATSVSESDINVNSVSSKSDEEEVNEKEAPAQRTFLWALSRTVESVRNSVFAVRQSTDSQIRLDEQIDEDSEDAFIDFGVVLGADRESMRTDEESLDYVLDRAGDEHQPSLLAAIADFDSQDLIQPARATGIHSLVGTDRAHERFQNATAQHLKSRNNFLFASVGDGDLEAIVEDDGREDAERAEPGQRNFSRSSRYSESRTAVGDSSVLDLSHSLNFGGKQSSLLNDSILGEQVTGIDNSDDSIGSAKLLDNLSSNEDLDNFGPQLRLVASPNAVSTVAILNSSNQDVKTKNSSLASVVVSGQESQGNFNSVEEEQVEAVQIAEDKIPTENDGDIAYHCAKKDEPMSATQLRNSVVATWKNERNANFDENESEESCDSTEATAPVPVHTDENTEQQKQSTGADLFFGDIALSKPSRLEIPSPSAALGVNRSNMQWVGAQRLATPQSKPAAGFNQSSVGEMGSFLTNRESSSESSTDPESSPSLPETLPRKLEVPVLQTCLADDSLVALDDVKKIRRGVELPDSVSAVQHYLLPNGKDVSRSRIISSTFTGKDEVYGDDLHDDVYGRVPLDVEVAPGERRPLEIFYSLAACRPTMWARTLALAEDRLLPQTVICQAERSNHCAFLAHAHAFTDVPSSLAVFLRQRRRWTNGSVAAMFWSLRRISWLWWGSRQPLHRRLLMTSVLLQSNLVILMALLSPFVMLCMMDGIVAPGLALWFSNPHNDEVENVTLKNTLGFVFSVDEWQGELASDSAMSAYSWIAFVVVVLSHLTWIASVLLGVLCDVKRPGVQRLHRWTWIVFSFESLLVMILSFSTLWPPNKTIVGSLQSWHMAAIIMPFFVANAASPVLVVRASGNLPDSSLLSLSLKSIFYRFIVMQGWTIVNTNYAVSRLDDLSWGTKSQTSSSESKQRRLKQKLALQKWLLVIGFILICSGGSLYLAWIFSPQKVVLYVVLLPSLVASLPTFLSLFSWVYQLRLGRHGTLRAHLKTALHVSNQLHLASVAITSGKTEEQARRAHALRRRHDRRQQRRKQKKQQEPPAPKSAKARFLNRHSRVRGHNARTRKQSRIASVFRRFHRPSKVAPNVVTPVAASSRRRVNAFKSAAQQESSSDDDDDYDSGLPEAVRELQRRTSNKVRRRMTLVQSVFEADHNKTRQLAAARDYD